MAKHKKNKDVTVSADRGPQLNPDRKIFIMARGFQINDKEQIVQFVVPGFNMVESLKMPLDASDDEINKSLDTFRLKVSGDIQDWAQALASADKKKQAEYQRHGYDQNTYDLCWLVNEAVESGYRQLSQSQK